MSLLKEIQSLSESFQEPVELFSSIYNGQLIRKAPLEALVNMSRNNGKDIRIFSEGEFCPDLESKALSTIEVEDEDIIDWLKNLSSREDIFLAINKVDYWHEEMARWCAQLFKEIENDFKNELLHLEVTYFIGNPRYTPFGVHIDEVSDALHLNLGPNDRSMVLWDKETYVQCTGSTQSMFDPDAILSKGTEYQIKKGQWFYLPASRYYHIGVNNGFSLSLAIALIRYDAKTFVEKAVQQKATDLSVDWNSLLPGVLQYINESSDVIDQSRDTNSSSFSIEDAIMEYTLRIKSNGGFRMSPRKINKPADWEKGQVSLVKPFPIYVMKESALERYKLFARGNVLHNLPIDVLNLVTSLQSGNAIKVNKLIQSMSRITPKSILLLLSYLIQCQAIEVVNDES